MYYLYPQGYRKQFVDRLFEYTPLQIKQALTGNGRAEKKQVQFMVKNILGLNAVPKPDDAADALAVALCHSQTNSIMSDNSMWEGVIMKQETIDLNTTIDNLTISNSSKKLLNKLGCVTLQDALNLDGLILKDAKVKIKTVRNLVYDLSHTSFELFMNSKLKQTIKNNIVGDIIYNEERISNNKKDGYVYRKDRVTTKSLISRILFSNRKLKDEDIIEL